MTPCARRNGLPYSLHHYDIARWLFIILLFSGILSTGWFGIPLAPKYLANKPINLLDGIFALFSALGTIWGVMAYRGLTRSATAVLDARDAAKALDPAIGEYEYKSYNPLTKEYDDGFVPSGPADFWDKETHVPQWMDKGKYWHILLALQKSGREIVLHVVKDSDLGVNSGARNAAVTCREKMRGEFGRRGLYRYVVRIPQWLVMIAERERFSELALQPAELSALIADFNRKVVAATDEVAGWEKERARYPWRGVTVLLFLNKSLPLHLAYRQAVAHFPGAKKREIQNTNANLANISDDQLLASLMHVAAERGIPEKRLEQLELLLRFLKNEYARQGFGEGSSEYHNFHHSLEVSYMALHMLPRELMGYTFGPGDYEAVLVAGLLHDYDPLQSMATAAPGVPVGPLVERTMKEIERTRIIEAYYTMTGRELRDYFTEIKSMLQPPSEFATTHPEYVKTETMPVDGMVVKALIWRTDFPFFRQKLAQEEFAALLRELGKMGADPARVKLVGETLWLADLSVTYMGSDPIRAWDRVVNLYDELYLPKMEAVYRTDAFFADFAEMELFKQLIAMKNFPAIFRQRWDLVYQFFHEGNPSTQLNRTIASARKAYLKVNLEIGMKRGEMLQAIASDNWAEYFVGIGKDQREVMKAKARFMELEPQNASAFWGDAYKLVPSLTDGSVDNMLFVLPERTALASEDDRWSFRKLLASSARKLRQGGSMQLLTDANPEELAAVAGEAGFQAYSEEKSYFPKGWGDADFAQGVEPQVVILKLAYA